MQKKLTIIIDEKVYEGLYSVIEKKNISQFIEELVSPYVVQPYLEAAHRLMAQEEDREREALAWADALIGDADHETG